MKILVDLDGVKADFERQRAIYMFRRGYPTLDNSRITEFYGDRDYARYFGEDIGAIAKSICYERYFFSSMPVIEGSIDMIRSLEEMGHTIEICTSPLVKNPWCYDEKRLWVREMLGPVYEREMHITSHKYKVEGDFLIDDRPNLVKDKNASWKHVLFRQSWNLNSTTHHYVMNGPRDFSWLNENRS